MGAGLQTLVASLMIVALNLATGVLTARLLGPAGRGELAAIVMWPQFFAFLLTLGLPSSLLYNLKLYPESGAPLFSAVLGLGGLMGGMAAAAGAVLIPLQLHGYSLDLVRFAQWGMVVAPLALFSAIFICALLARHEFGLYNAFRIFQPMISLVLLGALAVGERLDPYSAAAATLAAFAPTFFWMLQRFWRIYPPGTAGLGWALSRIGSYGLRSWGADLLSLLSEQVDRVIVVALVEPRLMGLYVVAVSFSQVLNVFPTAAVAILFPKASGRSIEQVIFLTGRTVRVEILAAVAAAALGAILGPWLLDRIYGREYLAAAAVLRILLLEGVMRGAIWVLTQAFMALDKPGLVSILQGLGLALSVPLLLVLAPRYGLVGAGLALLVATSVRLAFILACFPIALNRRPPRLWAGRADIEALWIWAGQTDR